jgi:hypothetical protein
MPPVDGTLGYGAFKGRLLRLDFRHHLLEISRPALPQSTCEGGKISLITFGTHGPPIVTATGFRINKQPVLMQVDTMYTGTMLVYPDPVSKVGLVPQSSSGTLERFAFTDGGVDMIRGNASTQEFKQYQLGTNLPVYFGTPQVHVPDALFDGTVGLGVLKLGTASLDFVNMCFNFGPAIKTTQH